MAARPAPLEERLGRAEALIAEAAVSGAQLVVLPEVFNTGYAYTDANYLGAEHLDGPTVSWMKRVAAQYQVHVAGTLFLLDAEDIYNAMLLVAPDGRCWRYDKNYPWYWERAYFREGDEITIADTGLGRFGLMICWDSAHPELWGRYAGRVDAVLVCSSPPVPQRITVVLEDGRTLKLADGGPLLRYVARGGEDVFGALLRWQARYAGVPVVNTTPVGRFASPFPLPRISLALLFLGRPDLWPVLGRARDLRIESDYFEETYIADASGTLLAQVAEGEGYALAEVELADHLPGPRPQQPRFGLSPLLYVLFDWMGSALMVPVYRQGIRRAYGPHMAPVRYQTRRWLAVTAILVGLAGWLGGLFARRSGRVRLR
mgnify:CR=1 FL=1